MYVDPSAGAFSPIRKCPSPAKQQRTGDETQQQPPELHPDLQPMIKRTKEKIKREIEQKKGKFLETKAFLDAQNKLQKNRVLVIKGNTGDGKTSTAIQLLHWLVEEQQCRQPLQLHEITKLDLLAPNSHLITFIDDIFGENDVGRKDVQEWNKRITDVETLFDGEQIQANFLLITVRNEIFNTLKKSSIGAVFTEDNIIDLSSGEYRIAEEKKALLEMYKPENFSWTEGEIEKILSYAPHIGFPQCCQLFCKSVKLQDRRVEFFEKPLQFFMDALLKLPECSAILFLFLNGGEIKVTDLDPNEENKVNKTLLEEAFDINLVDGEDNRTQMSCKKKIEFVKKDLERLQGFLVRKEKYLLSGDEVYRFDHNSIYVTVALLYGNKTRVGYIKNCPTKFLSFLTTSKTSSNMVVISADHYPYMCERLHREFVCEKRYYGTNIGSLDVWKDSIFLEKIVRIFNERGVNKVTLFNKACYFAAEECALYLLEEGVKPDKDTPLWSLFTRGDVYGKGDVDVLRKVFTHLSDEVKLDLLNKACLSGSEECALYLLCEGVKPDEDTDWWSLITRGDVECGKGDVDILKRVVKYLNDEIKLDLLNKACASNSEQCTLHLLCEGVEPDKDIDWWSWITRGDGEDGNGDVEACKKVVKYLNDEVKLDLLNKACRSGLEECALFLLSEGVKPDRNTDWWPLITGGEKDGKGDVDILQKVAIYLDDDSRPYLLLKAFDSDSEECALYLLYKEIKPGNYAQLLSWITRERYDRRYMYRREIDWRERYWGNSYESDEDSVKEDIIDIFLYDQQTRYLLNEGGHVKGDVDVLKKVVKYLNDEEKLNLLNRVCRSGSEEYALYLLYEGVIPDENTDWWLLITGGGKNGKGDVNILQKVDIYLNDARRRYLLRKACRSGSEECALYLLCKEIKPDNYAQLWSLITRVGYDRRERDWRERYRRDSYESDESGEDSLKESTWYLLCEGVIPVENIEWWPLIIGGEKDGKGDENVLQKVVKYLNDEQKLFLLNKACRSGSEEGALYLLCEGVKPYKDILLHVAEGGNVNLFRKLLKYDVTLTVRDNDNNNVLHVACEKERKEMVAMLCEDYPNLLHDTNHAGQTPLHVVVPDSGKNCT
ncbi:uncharacterized protein LOC117326766 [Pecten maximus]|uniref:uncharacterized protein LOC117326766 n=1 Tax=Pecten maximus TaxID=6579 RepID=UPI0014580E1F|nr:uncharacterized protein LOC117326766 [Pecten maximus]